MKRRILFVDDEPLILDAMRQRMRRQRGVWEMSFADGGAKACELMEGEPVDVIVTDMRMPQMDGAALLRIAQQRFPNTVRIVLSGHADFETALRAVPVAHQYLTKPCEAGVLENVIERACNLQALINDEAVRSTVAGIRNLPSLPRVHSELVSILANENVAAADVADVLKQDMAMCAKILQIVNSAFFRLSRTISRIEDAVTYLGFNTIKRLSLAVEGFRHGGSAGGALSFERLQAHALLTGSIAYELFDDRRRKEDAFLAALLHDIGVLVLANEMPTKMATVIAAMRAEGLPMHAAEARLGWVTHAEIGAFLLGLWGLPYPIVEAVANHHAPERVPQREFDILAAVHVANQLANEVGGMTMARAEGEREGDPIEYLTGLGVADKLPQWREAAMRHAEALSKWPSLGG
jgi:HD-like signal output (HDOD) protein